MKKPVWETKDYSDVYLDLDALKELIKEVEDNNWDSFTLRVQCHGYDGADLVGHYSRLETDSEYALRIAEESKKTAKNQAAILKKKEKQRKLYEKLKKEFES